MQFANEKQDIFIFVLHVFDKKKHISEHLQRTQNILMRP